MVQFDRRRLLCSVSATAAAAILPPALGAALASPILTRPIPSSNEALPLIGLGSWITFNVGDDMVARDACAEVMRAFLTPAGG